MISFEEIGKRRSELAQWEQANSQKIQIYEHALKIGQLLREDKVFQQSPYLLLRKIKKTRCEICYVGGGQKYLRCRSMFNVEQHKRCLIFNICSECFERKRNSRQWKIDLSSYQSMYSMVQKLRKEDQLFELGGQEDSMAQHKYLIFKAQLWDTIGQIAKAIERKKNHICRQLFSELNELSQARARVQRDIQQVILRQAQCTCKHQCCYCDYSGTHEELLKINCEYFKHKKQQNNMIQKVILLDQIQKTFRGHSQQKIFDGILKQVQLIIIEKMKIIQQTLNEIIERTSIFNFTNQEFMKNIKQNYCSPDANHSKQETIEQSQSTFQKDGKLNHLTVDIFNNFSQELRTIELNHMPEQNEFRRGFKRLNRLQNITVNNSQIGDLLIEDTIKSQYKTPKHKDINKQSHHSSLNESLQGLSKKSNSEFINLLEMVQLKKISFNCQPKENIQFLRAIRESKVQAIYWKWNIGDFFSEFNEATHFPEQKSVLPSTAPCSLVFQEIYSEGRLKSLWIGECQRQEEGSQRERMLQGYLRILCKDKDKIDSIILGQFDGKSRKIDLLILKQLQIKKSLRSLLLHKIIINQQQFTKMLRSNSRLQSLYFNECQQINKPIFGQIEKLSILRKLSLIQVRKVYFTKSIHTLQVFFLQRCFGLVEQELQILLQQTRLQALSLYQCRFVDDGLIRNILERQIKNGSALQYLNLGYTKLSNQTLRVVNGFKLRALHIGGTQIDLLQLLQSFTTSKYTNLRFLEKLSMRDMRRSSNQSEQKSVSEYQNNVFSFIFRYLPILSHLDLSGNTRINERAIQFGLGFLVYLKVTDTQFTNHHLQKKIEHAGTQCPYYQMDPVSDFSQRGQRITSMIKLQPESYDIKIIF